MGLFLWGENMRIRRILTNNALVTLNELGDEQIVCGKGIGYKKRIGEEIDTALIEKVYVVADHTKPQNQAEQLLKEIPAEYIALAHRVIQMAQLTLHTELNDSLLLSLSDHLHCAMQRFMEGGIISNGLTWEVKRFYEKEFEVGLLALDMLEEGFRVRLPEAEAAFIAMHIINAESDDSSMEETFEITQIIQDISNIVRVHFKTEFDTNSSYYYRFITHLKYFARRVRRGEQYHEASDEDLAEIIFSKYKGSYRCACKIGDYLKKKYRYVLTGEETMYLTIHVQLAVNKGSHNPAESNTDGEEEEDAF